MYYTATQGSLKETKNAWLHPRSLKAAKVIEREKNQFRFKVYKVGLETIIRHNSGLKINLFLT